MYRYVNAMSLVKSKAELLIEGSSNVIEEHTAKLIMYGNYRPDDVNGWKKTICREFSVISNITLKPKGKRFDTESYYDLILSGYGDELKDKESNLSYWRGKLTALDSPYEDIDIDDDMIDRCNQLVNLYIEFCEMLSDTKEKIPYEVFRSKLDQII